MGNSKVLIAGGAGFIGSMVNKRLHAAGYETVVLDNLSRGGDASTVVAGTFIKGDIGDQAILDKVFKEHRINAVMHFAAFTDVGESVRHPDKYYHNNVTNTLTLLTKMLEYNIKNFIFSSSAAVYGIPEIIPMPENHPKNPINPYGRTKLIVEQILGDMDVAYGLRSSSLRYFNAAGGDPEGQIHTAGLAETNLIPLLFRCLVRGLKTFTINGDDYPTEDGTCIRDYIHVDDLATAHILALEQILNGGQTSIYNLGNGHGFSVKEVIAAVEKVTNFKIPAVIGPKRPGDPPILVADPAKAKKELGWQPQCPSLETIVRDGWNAYTIDKLIPKE